MALASQELHVYSCCENDVERQLASLTVSGDVVGSLQIRHSQESDEGKYECVAENNVGVAYSYAANLYVRGQWRQTSFLHTFCVKIWSCYVYGKVRIKNVRAVSMLQKGHEI